MGCTSSKNAGVVREKVSVPSAPVASAPVASAPVASAPVENLLKEMNAVLSPLNEPFNVDEQHDTIIFSIWKRTKNGNVEVTSVTAYLTFSRGYFFKSKKDEVAVTNLVFPYGKNQIFFAMIEFIVDFEIYRNVVVDLFMIENRETGFKIHLGSFDGITAYFVGIWQYRRCTAYLVVQQFGQETRYIAYFSDFVHHNGASFGTEMTHVSNDEIIQYFARVCKVSKEDVRANFGTN